MLADFKKGGAPSDNSGGGGQDMIPVGGGVSVATTLEPLPLNVHAATAAAASTVLQHAQAQSQQENPAQREVIAVTISLQPFTKTRVTFFLLFQEIEVVSVMFPKMCTFDSKQTR